MSMGSYMALPIAAALWGVDSRPVDGDRATRWWPANTRR